MKDVQAKRQREKEMVSQMIALYCRRRHHTHGRLCPECAALRDYACQRSDRCPFMETKTFCALYHRWIRANTVLPGRNAPILRQVPWPYGKYALRAFPCLTGFLLRQNCKAPASDGFSSDFGVLRCRRADARQGEKDKKRRKDTLSGVLALVHRW